MINEKKEKTKTWGTETHTKRGQQRTKKKEK